MKKQKKKSVKGMTLIEIIIAILVLGIMGTMMCAVASSAAKMMIDTNHLNNKTEVEAPVAIAQDYNGVSAAPVDNLKITIKSSKFGNDREVPATVKRYSTKEHGDALGTQGKTHLDGDIMFYTIS